MVKSQAHYYWMVGQLVTVTQWITDRYIWHIIWVTLPVPPVGRLGSFNYSSSQRGFDVQVVNAETWKLSLKPTQYLMLNLVRSALTWPVSFIISKRFTVQSVQAVQDFIFVVYPSCTVWQIYRLLPDVISLPIFSLSSIQACWDCYHVTCSCMYCLLYICAVFWRKQ